VAIDGKDYHERNQAPPLAVSPRTANLVVRAGT
jgi:hypothetical protein